MAPVTFRADLLACRVLAELVPANEARKLTRMYGCDALAELAWEYAAAFAAEHKRRNPLTGEPLYPHGALPVDHDPDAPAATSGAA